MTEVAFAGGVGRCWSQTRSCRIPQLWVLFVVAALLAALDGLQRPSLDALVPRLVDRDELAAAGALSSLRDTVGMIAGPALGGVLIADRRRAGDATPSTWPRSSCRSWCSR